MIDPPATEHGIGVGMGGSCPSCNTPVDLGQEYCLECGTSIKDALARTGKKQPQTASGPATPRSTVPAARKFPWWQFGLVLGLIVIAVVAAIASTLSSSPASKKHKKAKAAAVSTLSSTPGTPTGQTVTVAGCNGAQPPSSTAPTSSQQTTAGAAALNQPSSAASLGSANSIVPTTAGTTPTTSTSATVTVDENGQLCAQPTTSATATTPTTPQLTDPSTTMSTATTPTSGSTSSSSTSGALVWPPGTSGYTVVLNSMSKSSYSRQDANARAAQAQASGLSAGVLDSNLYSSLNPNLWVIFHGIYDTQALATAELAKIASANPQAYVRQVKP